MGASSLAIVTLLIVMGVGSWVSALIAGAGVTLPAYIGGMLIAALVRNLDDATGWLRLPHELINQIGTVCLALFLALALMTLDLSQLAGLGVPLLVMLAAQTVLMAAASLWAVWRVMGRDYDAAVMAGSFTGFMLGTSANAMAVMHALVARYGPAPRAFLVAPLVGAFFSDFTNALVITGFLNWLAP